jgi:hypothetical protein
MKRTTRLKQLGVVHCRGESFVPPSSDLVASPPPRRQLAGVSVPDTVLVTRAIEYARVNSEPYLFNHVMRSWLFAEGLAQQKGTPYEAEVLAVATLLHDLGLTEAFSGPLRFEVEGANAARAFARSEGLDERRVQLIWDSVALNSTPSICLHEETEVAMCVVGVGLDWGGWGRESIAEARLSRIVEALPRLEMKQRFTRAICHIVETRPETTCMSRQNAQLLACEARMETRSRIACSIADSFTLRLNSANFLNNSGGLLLIVEALSHGESPFGCGCAAWCALRSRERLRSVPAGR